MKNKNVYVALCDYGYKDPIMTMGDEMPKLVGVFTSYKMAKDALDNYGFKVGTASKIVKTSLNPSPTDNLRTLEDLTIWD